MPVLSLFGTQLQLIEGVHNFNSLGGINVAGVYTLTSAAKTLELSLQGRIQDIDLDLRWRGTVTIAGNAVAFGAASQATVVASLHLPDGSSRNLSSPTLTASADAALGLQIIDRNAAALDWLRARLAQGVMVDLGSTRAVVVVVDIRQPTAVHRPLQPAGPKLRWFDSFTYQLALPRPAFEPRQLLTIDGLAVDSVGFDLSARPDVGALFVHADLLDTSAVGNDGNQFLFQHALANGRLRVAGRGTAQGAMTWEPSVRVAADPVLLLLRCQDEHGYPIAFAPRAPLPITPRFGILQTVRSATDADAWISTNQANLVGSPDGSPLRAPGRLRALDPRVLYTAFSDDGVAKNSLSKPWFVRNGIVPLSAGGMPRELHGLSRGVRLEWARSTALAGQDDVVLRLEPEVIGGQKRFHHTFLELGEAGQWAIRALREERDVRPEATRGSATTIPSPVGSYRLTGVPGGGAFSLPAIDTAFAVANLAGPDRINDGGQSLSDGPIVAAVSKRLQATDSALQALFQPEIGALRHVDGARLAPAPTQAFQRLLERIPTAADVGATGRIGPDLRGAQATHALLVASPDQSHLVFGGEEGPVSDTVKKLSDAADKAYAAGFDGKHAA